MTDERRLGRIATVGSREDGTLYVVPVEVGAEPQRDAIDVSGGELKRSQKFRDVRSDRLHGDRDRLARFDGLVDLSLAVCSFA